LSEKPALVHVEIFDQTYSVTAGADSEHIRAVAKYVDDEMREVSRAGGAVDSVRIAVLAALNIADECFRLRAQVESGDDEAKERLEALTRELSEALGE
jgi:cell division protein ZapA